MSEPVEMNLQDRMMILSFASKMLELLESGQVTPNNPVDLQQALALGERARLILARLNRDWPAMIPLPHDGVSWSER